MKSIFLIAMFGGLLNSHALAQFTGPVTGPVIEERVGTVAETRKARLGSHVTVTGHIVARQREDYYVFRDHTGEIRVEIENKVWQGRAVNPQTRVKLYAEVDRGVGGRYLWVESLAVLEERPPAASGQDGASSVNPPSPSTSISFQQAKDIALKEYPGTTLIKGELTRKGGRHKGGPLAWDMKLSNGMAVYVDAMTGSILEHEPWRR